MNEREAVLEETWLFFKKILGHWCEESLEVGLWSPIAFCDLPHTIGLLGAVLACWFLLIWVTLLGQFTQAGHFKQSGYLCLNLPRKKSCLCWGSGCTTQNLTLRFHENCRGKEHLWPSSGGRSKQWRHSRATGICSGGPGHALKVSYHEFVSPLPSRTWTHCPDSPSRHCPLCLHLWRLPAHIHLTK